MKKRSGFLLVIVVIELLTFTCCEKEEPHLIHDDKGPEIVPATHLASIKETFVNIESPVEVCAGFDITDMGGGTLINYGVCWSKSKYPTTTDNFVEGNKPFSSDEEYQIRGLMINTTYYLRAFATNSIGKAYGEQISFTTPGFNPVGTPPSGSVTDIDGNIYKTVQIGTQEWMAENLKTTTYNDGSNIYYCSDGGPAGYTEWFGLGIGAYCWYDNNVLENKDIGAIYNWHAVKTRKLCPEGWHVPSYSEWVSLITFLGGVAEPFSEWSDNASVRWGGLEGNIEISGLNPDPGGCLDGFGFLGKEYSDYRYWWTSDPYIKNYANVPYAFIVSFRLISDEPQSYGLNVRCLKDN